MSNRRRGGGHPLLALFGMLFVLGLIIKFWYLILAALVLAGAVALGVRWSRQQSARRATEARRCAELSTRADYEHARYLAGDPAGLYGRYPPADPGPPITRPPVS